MRGCRGEQNYHFASAVCLRALILDSSHSLTSSALDKLLPSGCLACSTSKISCSIISISLSSCFLGFCFVLPFFHKSKSEMKSNPSWRPAALLRFVLRGFVLSGSDLSGTLSVSSTITRKCTGFGRLPCSGIQSCNNELRYESMHSKVWSYCSNENGVARLLSIRYLIPAYCFRDCSVSIGRGQSNSLFCCCVNLTVCMVPPSTSV